MTNQEAVTMLINRRSGSYFGVTNPVGPKGVGDYAQCTAVPHDLQRNILGLPLVYGNAADVYSNASASDYQKLSNRATPTPGDIVVWGQNAAINTGPEGHIAVVIENLGNGMFASFDQNWPTGARTQRIIHSLTGVIGFLRPSYSGSTGATMNEQINARRSVIREVTGVWHGDADIKNNHLSTPLEQLAENLWTQAGWKAEYGNRMTDLYKAVYGSAPSQADIDAKYQARIKMDQIYQEIVADKLSQKQPPSDQGTFTRFKEALLGFINGFK